MSEIEEHFKKAREYEKTLSLSMGEVLGDPMNKGLVFARGLPDGYEPKGEVPPTTCPVWKDKLPYKSLTVIFDKKDYNAVTYWLSYIHGGDNISREKNLQGDIMAIRSDYMCW